ncbi:type VI lipase adapter Tla3 domain-containing protein [Pseudomonas agarici]|uniref:type VI lipase adapter Tla3 domain-containing protein n=1 Tax=Pseudomonas agarici TaxID=46677 RepID=UPI0015A1FB6E|nr:DUF2875 family protein [Pseudomonas agarici]NWB93955.1 DUF2875 family protein [Pseudomonas agarici]
MTDSARINPNKRPRFKPYFQVGYFLLLIWLLSTGGYLELQSGVVGMNVKAVLFLKSSLAGLGVIFVGMTLVYAVVWVGKTTVAEHDERQALLDAARQIQEKVEDPQTFALEIRGAGLAVEGWQQSNIWRLIQEKNDNFVSIYSQNPEDYPDNAHSRTITAKINVRAASRHSAGEAVAYWPIPTFALGPPKQPEDTGAATNILGARNGATLGVTLFLWQDADNTTHAQTMIERLFSFFDENQQVPQALIISRDGDVTRSGYRVAGTPGVPNGHYVPTIFESMTGLLVSRTDRVDRYIRPYALDEKANNQDKSSSLGMLWAFYWASDRQFDDWYEAAQRAQGREDHYSPGTMSTAYWQAQLPALQYKLGNQYGPGGHFQASSWLPIRWTKGQLKEFDTAPMLGYLHRPIKVPMTDADGQLLKPALQALALQAGWERALATLPEGEKPVRVFYDSTDNIDGVITLHVALSHLNLDGTGLAPSNVNEGYDIGRRLGNTGVSSALVQINLATIASYQSGGISAVVYSGSDASATIQMVRPPDETSKARNTQWRSKDPFKYGAP